MNKLIIITLIAPLFLLCSRTDEYYHKPGGPFYFESIITYQGINPNREITKDKSIQLKDSGYAFYVGYFNNDGKPTLLEKYYKGNLFMKYELFYENKKLNKTITTDDKGIQKIDTIK
jgi:hypothetical protein